MSNRGLGESFFTINLFQACAYGVGGVLLIVLGRQTFHGGSQDVVAPGVTGGVTGAETEEGKEDEAEVSDGTVEGQAARGCDTASTAGPLASTIETATGGSDAAGVGSTRSAA